jgi:type IV pilus assembly protein PilA
LVLRAGAVIEVSSGTVFLGFRRFWRALNRTFVTSRVRPGARQNRAMTQTSEGGFTLIEMLVVVAVLAILAMIAMPSMQDKVVRDQIIEAVKLADIAKSPVAAAWSATKTLPADNAAAGLPAADKIVSNLVSSVVVDGGAIHLTFGNRASAAIKGKVLTLRPAVVDDAPIVPVAWVCGHAKAPDKMDVKGMNKTDLKASFLPMNCRA